MVSNNNQADKININNQTKDKDKYPINKIKINNRIWVWIWILLCLFRLGKEYNSKSNPLILISTINPILKTLILVLILIIIKK